MYRVAVIQNGIEMQHSGYVDAVSRYKQFASIGREKAEFTRFSGINIHDLFSLGENFILDFDAIILGTNATSDDDVYNVLREEKNKQLLNNFIEDGNGILICSQKKYQKVQNSENSSQYKIKFKTQNNNFLHLFQNKGEGELIYNIENINKPEITNKRISGIMPSHYEYMVTERPSSENSDMGMATLIETDRCTLNQKCLINLPNNISNDMISKHCKNNSFQEHYYRDILLPAYNSAYQPIIIDNRQSEIRNLLMVAVPQKRERIIISTMALDWAGHDELLENIINYLILGIPHTAFVHKNNYDNNEMKILTLDAYLAKVGYKEYDNIDTFLTNSEWHSLIIFSPDFSSNEVLATWKKIPKEQTPFTQAYHYQTIEDNELVLVKYSNNTYIEHQMKDVLAWLNSKRGKSLWSNSLWKTFDVVRLLHIIDPEHCLNVLNSVCHTIMNIDDQGRKHYKADGSYDGVLAPSCGILELFHWNNEKNSYEKTKNYLTQKYITSTNLQNKMFILKTFYHCNEATLTKLLSSFPLDDVNKISDKTNLDLCLIAEISIIFSLKQSITHKTKQILSDTLKTLCSNQSSSGKWDNLSNTATILIFLLQEINNIKQILSDSSFADLLKNLQMRIDHGIIAIKTGYSITDFNWENNIVTTSNSLLVLYLYDSQSKYKSKDFLREFLTDSHISSSYNALNIALNTLDKAVNDANTSNNELYKKTKLVIYHRLKAVA